MAAAWAGQVQAAKLLLERGADVDAKNISGRTAMDYARGPRLRPVLELLYGHRESLTRGGGQSTRERSFKWPVCRWETRRQRDKWEPSPCIEYRYSVRERPCDGSFGTNHRQPWCGDRKALRGLPFVSISPIFDDDEFPPLIEAAASSDLQKIKSLIAQGADCRREDELWVDTADCRCRLRSRQGRGIFAFKGRGCQ